MLAKAVKWALQCLEMWREDCTQNVQHDEAWLNLMAELRSGLEADARERAELVGALRRARRAMEELAQRGTERILELGHACDPWERTLEVACRQCGIDEVLERWCGPAGE